MRIKLNENDEIFQGKSSDYHFSNSAALLKDGINASGEAAFYAVKATYNTLQVTTQATLGVFCALELTKNGIYINSGLSSDSALKPYVKNFLIFAADNPLTIIGIGAAAMILLYPEPALNACKNIAGTVYKLGEATIDIALATEEGLVGIILLTKEKGFELKENVADTVYKLEEKTIETATAIEGGITKVVLLTKEKANEIIEYLTNPQAKDIPDKMFHLQETIFFDQANEFGNDVQEWTSIESENSLSDETENNLVKLIGLGFALDFKSKSETGLEEGWIDIDI